MHLLNHGKILILYKEFQQNKIRKECFKNPRPLEMFFFSLRKYSNYGNKDIERRTELREKLKREKMTGS